MIREERRKKRRRKHILIGFLTTLLILALAAHIVIKVFTVKNVEVEGNKLYSDEQIKEWVFNDDYSWNPYISSPAVLFHILLHEGYAVI